MSLLKLSSGLTLGYDEAGSGPPLVLLHAFPLDRTMWAPQLSALADAARVVALDLPGFGESSPAPFSMDGVADVVADALAAMKLPKAIIGGLSMGGYVALAFARRHTDKLSGLILADTRAGVDDNIARENRAKAIQTVRDKNTAALFEGMLPKALSEQSQKNPELVERLKGIAARQSSVATVAAIEALRDRPDANPGLKGVTVPTLVLVGEHDALTPPLAAANLAAQIRGSKLVHIAGAGHLSNVENPEAFNAAVRKFLVGQASGLSQ